MSLRDPCVERKLTLRQREMLTMVARGGGDWCGGNVERTLHSLAKRALIEQIDELPFWLVTDAGRMVLGELSDAA